MNLLDMEKLNQESTSSDPTPSNSSRLEPFWKLSLLKFCSGSYQTPGSDSSASELERKLGKIYFDSSSPVSTIGSYWITRHGFSKTCQVFPSTGDNPATFLSFPIRPKEAIISLGTSDTVLVSTEEYNPHPEFHAFINPASSGIKKGELSWFNMLVYKNGSLAREWVRDEYCGKDWGKFNRDVEQNSMKEGEERFVAFYWLKPEIIVSLLLFRLEGSRGYASRAVHLLCPRFCPSLHRSLP